MVPADNTDRELVFLVRMGFFSLRVLFPTLRIEILDALYKIISYEVVDSLLTRGTSTLPSFSRD